MLSSNSSSIVTGKCLGIISGETQAEITVGFITAFLTGVITCKWMIRLVKKVS